MAPCSPRWQHSDSLLITGLDNFWHISENYSHKAVPHHIFISPAAPTSLSSPHLHTRTWWQAEKRRGAALQLCSSDRESPIRGIAQVTWLTAPSRDSNHTKIRTAHIWSPVHPDVCIKNKCRGESCPYVLWPSMVELSMLGEKTLVDWCPSRTGLGTPGQQPLHHLNNLLAILDDSKE